MYISDSRTPETTKSLSPSTTISYQPQVSSLTNPSSLLTMAFNLSLYEAVTALIFLLVCGKGVVKLATQFRPPAPEAASGQEDIELGTISVADASGDGDA